MTDKIVVLTTCANRPDADRIAKSVVEQRLAACVSVVEVSSTYRWKDAVEQTGEWMLIVKTRRELFGELQKLLDRIHPYEVPEVVALPVIAGSAAYLDWIDKETRTND